MIPHAAVENRNETPGARAQEPTPDEAQRRAAGAEGMAKRGLFEG